MIWFARLGKFLGCALLLGAASAAPPNEKAIAELYARGLAGDARALRDCVAALEQTLAARPEDQLARVYLGSAETLRSRDLPFGLARWKALRRGIALMEGAAAAAPENARVQLLRGVTYEAFPAVLGKAAIARAALDQLVLKVERDPQKLRRPERQLLYLNAGEAAKKAGDNARARMLWQRGEALAADPKLTAEIHSQLKALPQ